MSQKGKTIKTSNGVKISNNTENNAGDNTGNENRGSRGGCGGGSKCNKRPLSINSHKVYTKLLNDKELTFDKFCKMIRDEKVKYMTNVFLMGIFGKKTQLYKAFKVELFLSIFLIHKHHEIVFEGSGTIMDNNLLELVREIVIYLREDIMKHKNTIVHKLIEFKEKFNIWKQMDLNSQLKLYSETYYELELLKMKVVSSKEAYLQNVADIYLESINPLQLKIKGLVKYLAGDKGLEYLEKYQNVHLKLTVELEKKLRENLKKAFWDSIQEDLMEDPPSFKQFGGLFKDIHIMFSSILSMFKHKIKSSNELNSILDIEYIEMLCTQGNLSENVILPTLVNIFDLLKLHGFENDDSKINKYIKEITDYQKQLENRNRSKNNQTDSYNDIYPNYVGVIKLIIELLEKLQKWTIQRKISMME